MEMWLWFTSNTHNNIGHSLLPKTTIGEDDESRNKRKTRCNEDRQGKII